MKAALIMSVFAAAATAEWRACGSNAQTKAICKTSMHKCKWNFKDMCDVGKANRETELAFLEACQGEGVTESLSCNKARNKTSGVNVKVLIAAAKKAIAEHGG
ncbi:hypothetical protein NLG97_g3234 [Lecanicillium saksenae]|uniref:Uncharacterized protein n=1 Tax=Lecanicillium saksenae TaxID=468837 RepID=A0ACC1R0I8_9HYPO|nr:hypothetical protein NLG97_g3234 [Lecanicillium saksenae]